MSVNDGAGYALDTTATVNCDVTGATNMRFAATTGDPPQAGDWSSWSAYSDSRGVTLPWGDGLRRVYGQFRNAYGAVLELEDDIVLDLTAPQTRRSDLVDAPDPDDAGRRRRSFLRVDGERRQRHRRLLLRAAPHRRLPRSTTSWRAPARPSRTPTSSPACCTSTCGCAISQAAGARSPRGRSGWPPPARRPSSGPPRSTHPDQTLWYPTGTVDLAWLSSAPATTDGYSWAFDASASTVPDTTVDTTDAALNLQGQSDGLHYFHVRARGLGGVWGTTVHRQVRIDTDDACRARSRLLLASRPRRLVRREQRVVRLAGGRGDPPGSGTRGRWTQSASGEPDETIDGDEPRQRPSIRAKVTGTSTSRRAAAPACGATLSRDACASTRRRRRSPASPARRTPPSPGGTPPTDASFTWSASGGASARGRVLVVPRSLGERPSPTPRVDGTLPAGPTAGSPTACGTSTCAPSTPSTAGAVRRIAASR